MDGAAIDEDDLSPEELRGRLSEMRTLLAFASKTLAVLAEELSLAAGQVTASL